MSTDPTPTPWPSWPTTGADALEQDLLGRWREEGLFAAVQARGAMGIGQKAK